MQALAEGRRRGLKETVHGVFGAGWGVIDWQQRSYDGLFHTIFKIIGIKTSLSAVQQCPPVPIPSILHDPGGTQVRHAHS